MRRILPLIIHNCGGYALYINPEIILSAFQKLSHIAPENTGKQARERVSGLKYFFAVAELCAAAGTESVDLSTANPDNRQSFIDAVGRVVRLDDDGGYSNNFIDEFERARDYKVRNNFLTASLMTDGPYPGRPAPLILRDDKSVSLHDDYVENLYEYGELVEWALPIATWLLRFDEFSEEEGKDADALGKAAFELLKSRYGSTVEEFVDNEKDGHDCFCDFEGPLLVEDKPDYFTLLSEKLAGPISETAVPGVNVMVYGAPGTGKSYRLKNYAPCIRTVFHGDYQNSDFVGGYRPYVKDGEVTYSYVPGPFVQSFVSALKVPERQHYLIIEEINRANAGAVFGEVFQLLDRDENGRSEYEIQPDLTLAQYLDSELAGVAEWEGRLFMPSNLSVYATMNSADQGVEPLDSAFKRRWEYDYLPIRFDLIGSSDVRRESVIPYGGRNYSWCEIAEACNELLLDNGIEEDRLLGPYFLSNSDFKDLDKMDRVIFGKVFIYLWDDVLRHGRRDVLFKVDDCRSFYEMSKRYRNSERVFSSQLEDILGYSPPSENEEE
ncbi:MAG: AAA family ATPase [Planctomycetota bacterium]